MYFSMIWSRCSSQLLLEIEGPFGARARGRSCPHVGVNRTFGRAARFIVRVLGYPSHRPSSRVDYQDIHMQGRTKSRKESDESSWLEHWETTVSITTTRYLFHFTCGLHGAFFLRVFSKAELGNPRVGPNFIPYSGQVRPEHSRSGSRKEPASYGARR